MSAPVPSERLAIAAIFLLLAGCDPLTHEVQPEVAEDAVKRFSYAKDDFGICYAMTSSRTSHGLAVLSITDVPCDKVKL